MVTSHDSAVEAAAAGTERQTRWRHWSTWLALAVLLLGCIGLGIYASARAGGDQTFNFIALLIIFMTALAASSIVFKELDLSSKDEAFGLPTGSVRGLIAVGVMILFVVFGLPVVSSEPKELSSGQVQVPADQLAEVIRLNSEQGFVVRVHDLGRAAPPANAAGVPVAADRPARIEIVRMNSVTDEQMDLNRQLLTAIVTLLTTVVGFYFGSRSASDGARAAAPTTTAADPGGEGGANRSGSGGGGAGGGGESSPDEVSAEESAADWRRP